MDSFHKQIIENRNNVREKNLREDLLIWRKIIELNESDIKLFSKGDIVCELNSNKYDNQEEKDAIVDKIKSIVSTIFRIHSHHFKINTIQEIGLSHVKEYTQWILNLNKEIQLHFCKNPTKQGVDEKYQIMKLDEHISSVGLYVKNSTNHLYSQWRNLSEKNKE